MTVDQGIKDFINALGPLLKARLVPPGGTTGQILAKTSNADWADGWIDAPSGGGSSTDISIPRVLVSGRWVNTTITGTSMTTQAATANRLYLVPFVPSRDRTIDQLGCNVTTLLAGSVRMGVYGSHPTTGLPTGNPIVDAGTFSTGTTGAKTGAAVATFLSDTQYWTAIDCSVAATFTAGAANEMWPVAGGASPSNVGANHGYVTHTATNAFPNIDTLVGTITWATASVPMCSMRIA